MERVETRAIALHFCFLWSLIVVFFIWVLYLWIGVFTAPSKIYAADQIMPLIFLTLFPSLFSVLFGIATFPKMSIDEDSFSISHMGIHYLYDMENVEIDSKAHIIRVKTGVQSFIINNLWFVPFDEDAVFKSLEGRVKTYHSSSAVPLLYLLPLLFIGIQYSSLSRYGDPLGPIYGVISWGVVNVIFLSIVFYAAPGKRWIGNLSRKRAAILVGLLIGIPPIILMAIRIVLQLR